MTLFGDGRVALGDDPKVADRLAWGRRRPSLPDPEWVMRPRQGDPTREPWLAPPGFSPLPRAAGMWQRAKGLATWSYLAEVPAIDRYLLEAARPRRENGARIGVAGLGRVGGAAVSVMAALPAASSGIAELCLCDHNPANAERWRQELSTIVEWRGARRPVIRTVSVEEMFASCDAVAFSATAGVPPLGTGEDVRLSQFEPNRALLRTFLAAASESGFAGLLLIVSDPVECLAQAAFVDSNRDGAGSFTGAGLAPERIAGLALGVMWARALACAREHGWDAEFERHGAVYGPHSVEVEVFDDVRRPDAERSAMLSQAARFGNYRIRDLGFLPYVGPGVSSLALTMPRLLSGREILASVFLDGTYFGGPARLRWGLEGVARRVAPSISHDLDDLHSLLARRMSALGLTFASTGPGAPTTPGR